MPLAPPPTILLVDDDPTARFLVRRLLNRLFPAVQVLEAADGEQALTLVETHCQLGPAPHSLLVLLDWKMPVLNGQQFLDRYQLLPSACHQATSVVVSSSTDDAHELTQARTQAADVLPKPVLADPLASLVRQYLPSAAFA